MKSLYQKKAYNIYRPNIDLMKSFVPRGQHSDFVNQAIARALEHEQEKAERKAALKQFKVWEMYGKQLPPDLVSGTFRGGRSGFALFRTLSAGVGGTRMKGLHGRYSTRDIWAVVHYVRGLQRHRADRM